jgi:ABC-type nitrate/sulfonate/bicarbonate transport system permease component
MSRTISLRTFILPVFLIALWQAWGAFLPTQSRMPVPTGVLEAAQELIASGQLFSALLQSLGRVGLGFLLAGSTALIMGLAMGFSRALERNLDPIVETFRPIAPIALLPLAILWFGTGTPASVFVVGYAAFFPMIVNTIHGVKRVDRRMIQAAQTMGLNRWSILWTVALPAALPAIFVGARLAMGSSWLSIVAAELAVGSRSGGGGTGGIGQMMFVFYAYEIELNGIVVCMISVGVVALLIDRGLRGVQRRLMPWAREVAQ